jgi:hypothetical protein
MDAYTAHGQITALQKLGLAKTGAATESIIKELIRTNPGLVLGLMIGAGIGLHAMFSKDYKREQIPYRLEGNPLYYPQQGTGDSHAHTQR